MDSGRGRELFKAYASAAAYVEIELPNGDRGIGSAFHVGEGVFVTARHVVENNRVLRVGMTEHTYVALSGSEAENASTFISERGETRPVHRVENGVLRLKSGPHLHKNAQVDVAVFQVYDVDPYTPAVPLGSHLDDWLGQSDLVLSEAIILGYPPIPMTTEPTLIGTRAEVNAHTDVRDSPHVHFILSAMPRGGFSGGVAISEYDFALGMVTSSLLSDDRPSELGFMSVVGVEPIYVCLADYKLLPDCQAEHWNGFWNSTELYFYRPDVDDSGLGVRVTASVEVLDDGKRLAITITCDDDPDVLQATLIAAKRELMGYTFLCSEIRSGMQGIDVQHHDSLDSEPIFVAARAASKTLIECGYMPQIIGPDCTRLLPSGSSGSGHGRS